MVAGLNSAGLNYTNKLARLVARNNEGEIEFTSEGDKKANEAVARRIDSLIDKKMKPLEKTINQLCKASKETLEGSTYAQVLEQEKKQETLLYNELEKLCKKLSPDQAVNASSSEGDVPVEASSIFKRDRLITKAKELRKTQLTSELKGKEAKLKSNLLNICKRQYEQQELDDAFRRSVSHIAKIPLSILSTAFQLTKTLFKSCLN